MTRIDPALTKFRPCAAVLCVAFGVYGCATRYGSMDFMGGVDSVAMRPDMEMIVAEGNGFTSSSRLQQFVLLKAAQDCLANGYTSFAVMNPRDRFPASRTDISAATQIGYIDSSVTRDIPELDPRLHIPVSQFDATVIVRFTNARDPSAFANSPQWSNSMRAAQIATILGKRLAVDGSPHNDAPAGDIAPTHIAATAPPRQALPMPDVGKQLLVDSIRSTHVASALTVSPADTPQRAPSGFVPPSFGSAMFALQLGAYSAHANADNARKDFLKAHPRASAFQTDIAPIDLVGDRTLYRLQLGAFSSRRAAVALCDRLKAEGGDCIVVQATADVSRHGAATILSASIAKPH